MELKARLKYWSLEFPDEQPEKVSKKIQKEFNKLLKGKKQHLDIFPKKGLVQLHGLMDRDHVKTTSIIVSVNALEGSNLLAVRTFNQSIYLIDKNEMMPA